MYKRDYDQLLVHLLPFSLQAFYATHYNAFKEGRHCVILQIMHLLLAENKVYTMCQSLVLL